MAINVVTPGNLGVTLKPAHLAAGKYDVQVDNVTVLASVLGLITADYTNAGFVSAVEGLENLTTFSKSGNSYTYTRESGATDTGTFVDTVVLSTNPTLKTLTATINGVASTPLDISALYADINVDTFAWNAGTYVLTLTETDSTVHTLDLSSLVAITTTNTSTVTLSGNGTTGTALQAAVKVSSTAGNQLVIDGTGLFVAAAGAATVLTANDSTSIDFTTSGTDNHTLTGVVKFDPVGGNLAKNTGAGVLVATSDVTGLATVDVQDAFAVHLGYMFP